MKSLMSLWTEMAIDMAILCRTSATLDIKTAKRRFEHEGLSFLTITLPDLGKSTQKWIDSGQVGINTSFTTGRGSLPLFLGGFFNRVFDSTSGELLDEPSVDAIQAIRQLTLSFAKISLPCSKARVRAAFDKFIECEQDVRQSDLRLSESDFSDFQKVSDLLFRSTFSSIDRDIYFGSVFPKHGPGATADRLTSNGKWASRTWTRRLQEVFPLDRYALPNPHYAEEVAHFDILEPGAEIPVRVISVPKTLKTPRIIAIEPTCMQYMQQGVLSTFLESYKRDRLLPSFIGFDDQTPNQELARIGSLTGDLATLDLSEASDRVSNQLVRAMLHRWPHFRDAIDATRSRKADVPGHGVIRLAKYASMGSAFCFPMEAMVFLTIIFLGIQRSLNSPLSRKTLASFVGRVRVYGDDLIVPAEHVHMIVDTLSHFGAKVGVDKSFWTGKFRESCGKEYYDGHDVTIRRVRTRLPSTITDATEVISTVALRNQLYELGFQRSVDFLDKRLVRVLRHYPVVDKYSPVLGRHSLTEPSSAQRGSPTLHSPLVKGYVLSTRIPSDPLDGSGALLKCLHRLEAMNRRTLDCDATFMEGNTPWMPIQDQADDHLKRSGRPKRVSIKLGWWPSR